MAKTSTRDQELITKYIELDPDRPWRDRARIIGYGVEVWSLIGYLKGMDGNRAEVAAGFDLPVEAIEAAEAYYRRHKEIIDNRIDPEGDL